MRDGVAAAECAICVPIVVTLTVVTIEMCAAIFLKESITIAAYEGARIGVMKLATPTDVENQCEAILEARNVTGATITVEPDDFSGLGELDPITVVITAPLEGNSAFIGEFMEGREVRASVTMLREYDE